MSAKDIIAHVRFLATSRATRAPERWIRFISGDAFPRGDPLDLRRRLHDLVLGGRILELRLLDRHCEGLDKESAGAAATSGLCTAAQ